MLTAASAAAFIGVGLYKACKNWGSWAVKFLMWFILYNNIWIDNWSLKLGLQLTTRWPCATRVNKAKWNQKMRMCTLASTGEISPSSDSSSPSSALFGPMKLLLIKPHPMSSHSPGLISLTLLFISPSTSSLESASWSLLPFSAYPSRSWSIFCIEVGTIWRLSVFRFWGLLRKAWTRSEHFRFCLVFSCACQLPPYPMEVIWIGPPTQLGQLDSSF